MSMSSLITVTNMVVSPYSRKRAFIPYYQYIGTLLDTSNDDGLHTRSLHLNIPAQPSAQHVR